MRMSKVRLAAKFLIIVVGLCFGGSALGQSSTDSPSSGQSNESNKKKNKAAQDVANSAEFSDDVASDVLNDIREGLEGHSQRRMLAAFDSQKMDGYLTFEDQIAAMFQQYSEFRVHYRISQTSVEGPRGVVLVDFEMEEVPNSSNGADLVPQRRRGQVRFELERGKKGWKVVDFRPRGFFS